jgi:hypothetical protein
MNKNDLVREIIKVTNKPIRLQPITAATAVSRYLKSDYSDFIPLDKPGVKIAPVLRELLDHERGKVIL